MNNTEAIALLEAMLRIPSVSGNEERLAAFLVETMDRLGISAFIDRAGNAVGMVGDGPLTALLLGHMDTVPGDIPVRIENGKLYGRGAVDAKGPLAAFIVATARLAAAGALPLRVIIIGCVEEEAPSSRGAQYVVRRYRPDLCIVGEPSGWDALTLGYKGSLRASLRLEQPASHSAHAAQTAAERACAIWQRIHQQAERFNAGRTRAFDQLLPALVGINSGGDGRYNWAELQVSMRLPPDLPPDAAEEWLRETAGCSVNVLGATPAWSGSRTTPLHRALARAIRAQGGKPRYLLKTGTADLNLVAPAWGCPALAYGPGDAALDHTPDEHIVLDEYLRGIHVLEDTLRSVGALMQTNVQEIPAFT
ncbi:MAG: acetyl-lysine deacetylase [Herpetosiphonaceae bacterium]|nr:MAG: acetyl-lysine deacetylase [Herpetosiphonaceae bacterium]